jgi:hypothetical protein
MAKKSIIVLTSAIGIAAVAAGAYAARARRAGNGSIGTAKAKPLSNEWRNTDDALSQEFANVVHEESVSAH